MQYQEGRIALRQSKRRANISVIAHPVLAERLVEAAASRKELEAFVARRRTEGGAELDGA